MKSMNNAASESFKSDGLLKLSHIERQLIEDRSASALDGMNAENRGTQDVQEDPHHNNLSVIMIADNSIDGKAY